MNPGDPLIGKPAGHREPAERNDHLGLDQRDLLVEIGGTGGHLIGKGIAIPRRATLDDVRHKDIRARQADLVEHLVEKLPSGPDEWHSLPILMEAGRFPDEEDIGFRISISRHRVRARPA